MLNAMQTFITFINGYLWGPPMIILLFGTHLFMTVRTGFIQKKTFTAIKLSVTKDPDAHGDISQFGALTTALASTIGTGNIIGVGTAIAAPALYCGAGSPAFSALPPSMQNPSLQ